MKERIINLLHGESTKETIIVSIGNVVNAGLSMIFVYFCSLILTPFNFGLFSVCLTTWFLLQEIFDFGINNLVIRLASKSLFINFKKSSSIFKTGFSIKVFLSIVIFLSFVFWGRFLSVNLLNQTELYVPLIIIAFGEIGAMIFTSLISMVLTLRKFKLYTFLYSFQGLSRLILMGLFYYKNILTLNNLIIIFISAPFVTFIVGTFFLPKEIWQEKLEKKYFIKIISFIKWLALWAIFLTLSNRINIYIITNLIGPEKAGIYNLAYLFASIPLLLTTSLTSVFLPKISQFKTNQELPVFLKKSFKAIIGLVFLMILVMIPGSLLISIIFGNKYNEVSQIFQGIMMGMILVVLVTPLTIILWVLDQPKIFSIIAVGQFTLALLLGLTLIRNFGLNGAVFSFFLTNLFVFLTTGFYVLRIFKKRGLKL